MRAWVAAFTSGLGLACANARSNPGGGHGWPRPDTRGVRANPDLDTADAIFALFGIKDTPTRKAR